MKFLLAALLCLSSLTAFSSEQVILKKTYSKRDSWELFRTQYKVNTSLGRAWFKIELSGGGLFDELDYSDHRVMPQGMKFDIATGEIKINDTICATTRSTRRALKIYPTGRCVLTDRESTIQIDDGFNIITKKQLEVILEIR